MQIPFVHASDEFSYFYLRPVWYLDLKHTRDHSMLVNDGLLMIAMLNEDCDLKHTGDAATWPHPGRGVFAALLENLGERLLPLSSYALLCCVLPINTEFFRDNREQPCRDRF